MFAGLFLCSSTDVALGAAAHLRPEDEEKNMKSKGLVRGTSDDLLSPYVVGVTIEDEIAAYVTARAMGWVPLEGEDGLRSGFAQRTSAPMTRRTATQHSKWFAPTHIENKVSNHGGESPANTNA